MSEVRDQPAVSSMTLRCGTRAVQSFLVRDSKQADFYTTNIVDSYVRNSDRRFRVFNCHTTRYLNFFPWITSEWNRLGKDADHAC